MCLRSRCGDSLEVTFCSLVNHSLVSAVGDSGMLVVQYFMVVQSSAQFGRG